MRKKLLLFVAALCCTMFFTASAEVLTGYCGAEGDGSNLQWSYDTETTVLTITGSGKMQDYDWGRQPWNENSESITQVNLPNGLTYIGKNAFCTCNELTAISIPNSVTTIGKYAFEFCWNLLSVIIPNSVISIRSGAFGSCSSMTSLTIPNSVTSIGDNAFGGCTALTSVTIPNSVVTIGSSAFGEVPNIVYSGTAQDEENNHWGARSLNGVVDGWLVYSDNTRTTLLSCSTAAQGEIILPNSVTIIGNYAFCKCLGVTSVTIPNTVTAIGEDSFRSCGITSVTLPASITSYGDWAFSGCRDLKTVIFPENLTVIGNYMFDGCVNLTSVNIPNSVTVIGPQAFSGCQNLISVKVPDGVTSVGIFAFSDVPNIEYSGTLFGRPWNAKCMNGIIDGIFIFNDETKTILEACLTTAEGEMIIPNSVEKIGNKAFKYCNNITSVTIPNSVTVIDNEAFWGCKKLTNITIPNSVIEIGDYAFLDCDSVTSVVIGNSVTRVGQSAFGIEKLQEVHINDLAAWCGIFFNGKEANPLFHAHHLYLNGSEITELIIPDGVTQLRWNTFVGGSNFTSVSIPNSMTYIGSEAFKDCTGLTSVTIPNTVTEMGSSVFYGCTGLTSITLPNSITEIGTEMFYWCKNLTSVTIPESVTKISGSAFYGCSALASIRIPKAVTEIRQAAFWNCTGLTSIYCDAEVPPTCGSWAFRDVDKSIPLFVPAGSEEAYKAADQWKEFYGYYETSATEPEQLVVEPKAEPEENSVVVEWPVVSGATVYTIDIKKNGELICTLSFNESGQLIGISFAVPARKDEQHNEPRMATQTVNGWQYTISGLEANTSYTYTVTAKKSDESVAYQKTITFTTKNSTTAFEAVISSEDKATKVMRNGQLYILRDGKSYTITGAEVK